MNPNRQSNKNLVKKPRANLLNNIFHLPSVFIAVSTARIHFIICSDLKKYPDLSET